MTEDGYDDDGMEFWNIAIDFATYPAARGLMYAKPTPATVRARLTFPRMEPRPVLRLREQIKLTAYCASRRWMRGIPADVVDVLRNPDDSVVVELLLHRKSSL